MKKGEKKAILKLFCYFMPYLFHFTYVKMATFANRNKILAISDNLNLYNHNRKLIK